MFKIPELSFNRLDAMLTRFLPCGEARGQRPMKLPGSSCRLSFRELEQLLPQAFERGTGVPVEPREEENARLSPPSRGCTETTGAQCKICCGCRR